MRKLFSFLLCLFLSGCVLPNANLISNYEQLEKEQASDLNVQLGLAYLQNGNMERAKEKLLHALALAPHYSVAQGAMGYFLEKSGRPEMAEKYYLKAIALQPKAGSAHNNYGAFLYHQKRYDAAIRQFELAVKDPVYLTPAAAYENAGFCALAINKEMIAQHYFELALMRDKNRREAALQLAKLRQRINRTSDTQ